MKQIKILIMVGFLLTFYFPHANAVEPEEPEKTPVEQEQEKSALDFLEFLDEWETEDEDWIGPEDLENISLDETINE